MEDCPFCMIVEGRIKAEIIYEDERSLAFMDINPVADGHALIISKTHAHDLHAIAPEDLSAVALTAQRIAGAVRRAVEPEGMNLFQANGMGAGQTVWHFHLHVLPRHEGDGLPMSWDHKPGDPDRISEVAGVIRRYL